MTKLETANWITLYAATFCCCAFALAASVASVVVEMIHERFWTKLHFRRDWLLLVPRSWWRWQRRYLLSTPVTLGIVGWFATTLSW